MQGRKRYQRNSQQRSEDVHTRQASNPNSTSTMCLLENTKLCLFDLNALSAKTHQAMGLTHISVTKKCASEKLNSLSKFTSKMINLGYNSRSTPSLRPVYIPCYLPPRPRHLPWVDHASGHS